MSKPRLASCVKLESKPSNFCPGCGYGLILKTIGEVIDEMEIAPRTVFGIDIGCNLLAWDYYNLDTVQTHHGRVTPLISGYKRAQRESVVFGIAGDGGLYAIGLQSFLHTVHRNEAVTVIGVNNTLYAMTGGDRQHQLPLRGRKQTQRREVISPMINQFSGQSLLETWQKKEAYLARASVLNLGDLKRKIKKAVETQLAGNFSFVEVLSFCPTNWKTDSRGSVEMVQKLQDIFPLGEF